MDIISSTDRPSVSIIMPIETKPGSRKELAFHLQLSITAIEKELKHRHYPDDTIALMDNKLKTLIKSVNISGSRKGVVIYASPVSEHIYYLNTPVESQLYVDQPFKIRDFVKNIKEQQQYLVLVLSKANSRIILGNTSEFTTLINLETKDIDDIQYDLSERVSNFSDPSSSKDIATEKLLRYIDSKLEKFLKVYDLPIFLLGTEKMLGHFSKISHHRNRIVNYIHGNFDDADIYQLKSSLRPSVSDWKKVRDTHLLLQLRELFDNRKLACGIKDVWKKAFQKNGRLLVIEQNYRFQTRPGVLTKPGFTKESENTTTDSIDAVDEIIAQILSNGGDIKFVDDGMLEAYHHIALAGFH